MLKNIVTKQI